MGKNKETGGQDKVTGPTYDPAEIRAHDDEGKHRL